MLSLPVLAEPSLHPQARLLNSVLQRLAVAGRTRVALWGAGTHTRKCAGAIQQHYSLIDCIIDDAKGGRGEHIEDVAVVTRDEAIRRGVTDVVISSDGWEDAMWAGREYFLRQGIEVHRLYGQQRHEKMRLVIEISGLCNARCTYCPTGNGEKRPAGFMSVDLFRRILDHLHGLNLIASPIMPYNFGEPFIHPSINEILSLISDRGYYAHLSTNIQHLPRLEPESLAAIGQLEISLSGMRQESYARGHGGNLAVVLRNIDKFLVMRSAAGSTCGVRMRWHRYRFNEDELEDARAFCAERDIEFMPYFAHVNDLAKVASYFREELPAEQRQRIDEDLFANHMEYVVQRFRRTETRDCNQFHDLTIDEQGWLLPCCAVHNQMPGVRLQPVLELSAREILAAKRSWDYCNTCMASGWAGYVNSYFQPGDLGLGDDEFGARLLSDSQPSTDSLFARLQDRLASVRPVLRVAVWGFDGFTAANFGRFLDAITQKHRLVGFVSEEPSDTESIHGLPIISSGMWADLRPDLIVAAGHPATAAQTCFQALHMTAGEIPVWPLHEG